MRTTDSESNAKPPENEAEKLEDVGEVLYLQQADAQRFADELGVPELTIELGRAVRQVEASLEPLGTLSSSTEATEASTQPSEEVKR